MIDKRQLREQARIYRNQIEPSSEDAEAVTSHFNSLALPEGRIVGVYWPKGKEFDTRYLIHDLSVAGTTIVLPVPEKEKRVMCFRRWDGKSSLVAGEFGTLVPPDGDFLDPDILIVPFLAFDRRGYRLGQGGGHYDATISHLRKTKDILAIGVGYAAQAVLFNLPVEPHDQRLDMVITPLGVHDFR